MKVFPLIIKKIINPIERNNIYEISHINHIKGDGGSPLSCEKPNTDINQYYQTGMVAWGNYTN